MRKGLKRLLCVALCAVLLFACIGSASAAAKKKAEEPYFTKMFSSWYYVTSTIPAGMESTNRYSVSELSDKDYRIQEPAESCEVSFVSGDEALRDAVTVEEDHYSDGSKYFCIEIHNDKLTAVGQAVFKIVVESASLKWEGKEIERGPTQYLCVLQR